MDNKEAKIFAGQISNDLPTLDLHGMYPAEALSKLELFIYDQFLQKNELIKIIYGGGAGVLREKVLAYLQAHPLVDTLSEQGGSSVVLLVSG